MKGETSDLLGAGILERGSEDEADNGGGSDGGSVAMGFIFELVQEIRKRWRIDLAYCAQSSLRRG